MKVMNRSQIGHDLLARLRKLPVKEPVVFGLLPGGLLVAAEIARELRAPLRPLPVVEVAAPGFKGLYTGAITEDGHYWSDPNNAEYRGVSPIDMEANLSAARREMQALIAKVGLASSRIDIQNQSAVLVGDGLEGQISLRAGCAYLSQGKPSNLVVATPSCNLSTANAIEHLGAHLVSLVPSLDYYVDSLEYDESEDDLRREVDRLLSALRVESQHDERGVAAG